MVNQQKLVYSTYNLKQLNEKTNRVYLINEKTKSVDAQTPVSDSEKDNDCEFLQTPDGTNCSYIIDMFSIQALYKVILKSSFMQIIHILIMKKIT
ncbi:hypothetical protein [Spiroplasma poulsonii]|uniref:Uncharacterized protein n=1 Tax=Spiroplasma poulsonii TaxID=2138 RepID=A0A2P6F8I1_9MOLU|nr:hypothetical protein [Spiroplasma poulsonii]PQM29761.1 hypothetical protein SMSRO_SF029290 [Spiroplasma poulsonii]